MTDHDQSRASLRDLREEQIQEGRLAAAVERRSWFVGDDDLRRPDERASGCDALLLADTQGGSGGATCQMRLEAETRQQPHGLILGRALGGRACPAPGGEAQREKHVVDDRAVGEQVEDLENDTEVFGAETVARGR